MKMVAAFPGLMVKEGYVMRAYQYMGGIGGNGLVWATPVDAPFPEPDECSRGIGGGPGQGAPPIPEDLDRALPRPPQALDNFMNAIQGNGSPISYLRASILGRELAEFGAFWHGISWGMHRVLGAPPWEDAPGGDTDTSMEDKTERSDWCWMDNVPERWEPTVEIDAHQATVRCYSLSVLGCYSITEHVDTYQVGSYVASISEKVIATGSDGIVF